jgi:hypothetical protein
MPSPTDFTASGKITAANGNTVTFVPSGTNYELQLQLPENSPTTPLNAPIEGLIRVEARKVWTVPSGGNFITPIVGPPRIVQGRVRYLSPDVLVVRAGTNIIIALPDADTSFDLNSGPIAVGKMVNVTVLPGATFELPALATAI